MEGPFQKGNFYWENDSKKVNFDEKFILKEILMQKTIPKKEIFIGKTIPKKEIALQGSYPANFPFWQCHMICLYNPAAQPASLKGKTPPARKEFSPSP